MAARVSALNLECQMAKILLVKDTVAGTTKAVPYPGFVDENFTAGGTNFDLTHAIDDDNVIDVSIQGQLQDSAAWTRNSSLNRISLSESVSAGRSVRVRIYLHGMEA